MLHRESSPSLLTSAEAAILLIQLVKARADETGREVSRIRLARITLTRLWGRPDWPESFFSEVQAWTYRAGWTLFFAAKTFALVRTKTVEAWPRVSSKRLAPTLKQVAAGEFDFSEHFHLLFEHDLEDEDD